MEVRVLGTIILLFLISVGTWVEAAPGSFVYAGRIIRPDGSPLEASLVNFTLRIYSPGAESCLLYEETHALNMSVSDGRFRLNIGSGSRSGSQFEDTTSLTDILDNSLPTFTSLSCATGTSYTPTSGAGRLLSLEFDEGTGKNSLPAMSIRAVPYAIHAAKVGGLGASDLLQRNNSSNLTQTNLETVFADLANLQSLLDGSNTNYVSRGVSGASSLPTFTSGTPPSTPAPGDMWYDSDTNEIKFHDGTATQTVGTAGLPTVGTPGTYTKVTTDANGRVTSGSLLTEADIPLLTSSGNRVDGSALVGTIGGSTAINTSGNIATTGTLSATGNITSGANFTALGSISAAGYSGRTYVLYDSDNSNSITLNAPSTASLTSDYTLTLPTTAGSSGQVLKTNGAGILSWGAADSSITADSLDWSHFVDAMVLDATTSVDMDTNSANLNFDSGTLFIDSANNRVGVGTSSPGSNLDVAGTIRSSSMSASTRIGLNLHNASTATGSGSAVIFQNGSNVTRAEVAGLQGGASGDGELSFSTRQSGTLTETLRLDSSGRVGIGTTTPTDTLEISDSRNGSATGVSIRNTNAGTAATADLHFDSNSSNNSNIGHTGSAYTNPTYPTVLADESYWITMATGGISLISGNTSGSANMKFLVGGTSSTNERMRILRTGDVGIGTTTPGAKLEVAGQVKITGGSPGDGKVLTSDSTGLASWQTPATGGDFMASGSVAMTGNFDAGNNRLTNLAAPSAATDATTKTYVDTALTGKQNSSAELTGLAGLSTNGLVERTGAGAYSIAAVTAAGKALLDDADASAQRATLGLGSIATQNSNSVSITGGAIDGAAIGTTTAASGAFTSLTSSANASVGGSFTVAGDTSFSGNVVVSSNKTLGIGSFTNAQESSLIGSLGAGDKGKFWYDIEDDVLKYWNGSAANTLGISGAGLQSLSGDSTNAQTLSISNGAGVLAPTWNHNMSGDHELRLPLASAPGVTHGLLSKTDYDNFNSKMGTSLTNGQILIGDGSNVATGRTPSGDLSVSNTGVFTLANSGVTASTYKSVTVDAKGRVTGGTNPTTISGFGITDAVTNAGNTPSIQAGDTGSRPSAGTAGRLYVDTTTLKVYRDNSASWDLIASTDATDIASGTLDSARLGNSGVTASTYKSVTVDAKGRVTGGTNPTTISGFGITDGVTNAGNTPSIQAGLNTAKPAFGIAGRLYISTDSQEIYRDSGSAWTLIASVTPAGGNVNSVTVSAPLSNTNTAADPVIALTGRVPLANFTDDDVNTGYPLLSGGAGGEAFYGPLNLTSAVTGSLPLANGGTGATTAATARTNLGLGTAAVENIGTGIGNIPQIKTAFSADSLVYWDVAAGGIKPLVCNAGEFLQYSGSAWGCVPAPTDATAFHNNGDSFGGLATLGSNDNQALAFETNGNERMRILAGGSVGIGTSTPNSQLQVNGAVQPGDDAAACGASKNGAIRFNGGNLQVCLSSTWTTLSTGSGGTPAGANTQVQFNDGGAFGANSNFVWNNATGRLGVGLSSPNYALDVNGVINSSSNVQTVSAGGSVYPQMNIQAISTNGFPQWVTMRARGTSVASPQAVNNGDTAGSFIGRVHNGTDYQDAVWMNFVVDGTNVTGSGNRPGGRIDFVTRRSTDTGQYFITNNVMTIRNSGNVGIGTANPSRLFHVAGPMRVDAAALPGAPAAGDIAIDSGDANKLKYYNGSSWVTAGGGGSGDFMANGSVAMTGTFKATNGSANTPAITFANDQNTGLFADASDNLYFSTAGNARGLVDSSGGLTWYNSFKAPNGSSGAPAYSFSNDLSSGMFLPAANTVALSTNYTERLRINSSGNVGIGTTNPGRKLSVEGNDSDVMARVLNNSSTATRYPGYEVINYQGGVSGTPRFAGTTYRGNSGSPASVQSGDILVALEGAGGRDAAWSTNTTGQITIAATETYSATQGGSEMSFLTTPNGSVNPMVRMRISQNGNIGIGSTTPAAKLDIAGTVKVGGTGGSPCTASEEGSLKYNSTTKGMDFCNGSGWYPVGGGPTSCPAGFTMIGTPGARGSFCIDTTQRAVQTWHDAKVSCQNIATSDGSHAFLCDEKQWYKACKSGLPTGMTGDDEHVDELVYATNYYGVARGSSTCESIAASNITSPSATAAYRCCVN